VPKNSAPSLTEVLVFGQKLKANEKLCRKFYAYYSNSNWCNKFGREVEWRQALKNWTADAVSQPAVVSSCESPPVRSEDCFEHATMALKHARNETLGCLMVTLATFSPDNIKLALARLNDISLNERVKLGYEKLAGQQK
jgi:hypothetical protein